MSKQQAATLAFRRRVETRFGLVPSFFCSASAAEGLIEELWGFASAAYLDNPLPSIFKERLFVHLSRFCEIRYCVIRHVGFLIGHGCPAGDSTAAPQTVDDAIALLCQPVPIGADLDVVLSRLESRVQVKDLPTSGSAEEADLFAALTMVFLEPQQARRACDALRGGYGAETFERLAAFLAFIRTAHYWTETHPDITCEADMREVIEKHPSLAQLLLDPSDSLRYSAANAERTRIQAALRASEERFRSMEDNAPVLIWETDRSGVTSVNRHFLEFFGVDRQEVLGFGWARFLHPADADAYLRAYRDAFDRRIPFSHESRFRRSDGHYRWLRKSGGPVGDAQFIGCSLDITDLHDARQRQEVLVAELQHRTRNLLGVVRSMSDATMRTSVDLADFEGKFRDRLAAFARVQGLLSRLAETDRITFDELVRTELTAHGAIGHDENRLTLKGPARVPLRSSSVQPLAMALHELSTNAIKHGALGSLHGRLAVEWWVDPAAEGNGSLLHIDWRESGVDTRTTDGGRPSGQGRELIEKALPYQLKAETTFVLEDDGLHCTIVLPVSIAAARTRNDA